MQPHMGILKWAIPEKVEPIWAFPGLWISPKVAQATTPLSPYAVHITYLFLQCKIAKSETLEEEIG